VFSKSKILVHINPCKQAIYHQGNKSNFSSSAQFEQTVLIYKVGS